MCCQSRPLGSPHNLFSPHQSAYCKHQSNETAFLYINSHLINAKFCLNEWQEIWHCCVSNKLLFLFTTQLALWRIARICRATILYLSTDSSLVILD